LRKPLPGPQRETIRPHLFENDPCPSERMLPDDVRSRAPHPSYDENDICSRGRKPQRVAHKPQTLPISVRLVIGVGKTS
jgi:hypothetical protein